MLSPASGVYENTLAIAMQTTEEYKRGMIGMKQGFYKENWSDEDGNPAGGVATGRGFTISWQNGQLGRVGTSGRKEPNGAFVEDVIDAAISRIEFYQSGKFACEENAAVLDLLKRANNILGERTQRRTVAKTEGTHEGN